MTDKIKDGPGPSTETLTYADCVGPAHAECVDVVVREGLLIPGTEDVADSWRRCLTANHLDPDNRLSPQIITEREIKVSSEPLHNLILHAQEEIDRLYAIVGPEEYVVLLCNREGVAIHHRGDESKAEAFKYWGIWLGGVWSEDVEGTNGIGTCITEQRAEMVHRGQHFRTRHTQLSCAGAPIFDPFGELTAVLDTSSMDPETSEQSLSLVMAATKVSARAIEERVFREHFRSAWNVAAAPSGVTDMAVLLAVDNERRIVGADQVARRVFDFDDEALNRGVDLSSVFDYDPSIFRGRRMLDIPARLLRTGTDEPWNVLITPPASGWWSQTETLVNSRPRIGMLASLPIPITPKSYGGLPPATANRIYEYIDTHLQKRIALERLAEIAQLSVHHFARAFRQSVGMPPHTYIVRRRIERAQQLLRTTNLSLSEIAVAVGFTDQSHFSRHFRRLTGTSPGLARASAQLKR